MQPCMHQPNETHSSISVLTSAMTLLATAVIEPHLSRIVNRQDNHRHFSSHARQNEHHYDRRHWSNRHVHDYHHVPAGHSNACNDMTNVPHNSNEPHEMQPTCDNSEPAVHLMQTTSDSTEPAVHLMRTANNNTEPPVHMVQNACDNNNTEPAVHLVQTSSDNTETAPHQVHSTDNDAESAVIPPDSTNQDAQPHADTAISFLEVGQRTLPPDKAMTPPSPSTL